jgi:hypothetical protein
MKIAAAFASAVAVSALATPALAANIDFTSSSFTTQFYNESYWGDPEYTFKADDVNVTLSAKPTGAGLTLSSNEGIGVTSNTPGGSDPNINKYETLIVTFDKGVSEVKLSIYGADWSNQYSAIIKTSDGKTTTVDLPFYKEQDFSLSGTDITSIQLTSNTKLSGTGLQLGGLKFKASGGSSAVAVPELSTESGMVALALIGGFYLVVAGRRRRFVAVQMA